MRSISVWLKSIAFPGTKCSSSAWGSLCTEGQTANCLNVSFGLLTRET